MVLKFTNCDYLPIDDSLYLDLFCFEEVDRHLFNHNTRLQSQGEYWNFIFTSSPTVEVRGTAIPCDRLATYFGKIGTGKAMETVYHCKKTKYLISTHDWGRDFSLLLVYEISRFSYTVNTGIATPETIRFWREKVDLRLFNLKENTESFPLHPRLDLR